MQVQASCCGYQAGRAASPFFKGDTDRQANFLVWQATIQDHESISEKY